MIKVLNVKLNIKRVYSKERSLLETKSFLCFISYVSLILETFELNISFGFELILN
jgi:hypothetical protein